METSRTPAPAPDPLHAALDDLSAAWRELEAAVAGVLIEDPSCPLGVSRPGGAGRVRLCYKGRALAECTAAENLEAVYHLEAFHKLYLARRGEYLRKATEGAAVVRRYLDLFTKKEQ